MSEFNMEYERDRLRVLEARRALEKAQKEYDEVLATFRAKYPRAVVPTVD